MAEYGQGFGSAEVVSPWQAGMKWDPNFPAMVWAGASRDGTPGGDWVKGGFPVWPSGRHGLVLGPPRSGKGAAFFIPNILSAGRNPYPPNMVITDPKGELLAICGDELIDDQGYDVIALDFSDAHLSCGWNPLPWILPDGELDYGRAQTLAATIIPLNPQEKDPFWSGTARVVLAACAVLAVKIRGEAANLADVFSLAYGVINPAQMDILMPAAARLDDWAARQLQTVITAIMADSKLQGNLSVDLPSRYARWTTPPMMQILSYPAPVRWDHLFTTEKPWALFVLGSKIFADQQGVLFASMIDAIRAIQRRQNRLSRPLLVLGDEWGNVGQIPNLAEALTILPGAGVSFWLGLQSLSQLAHVYGPDEAKIIADALYSWIVFPGLGYESAKIVSDRVGIGEGYSISVSQSTGQGVSISSSISKHARATLTPDEISRIPAGHMLVHSADTQPCLVAGVRYFTQLPWQRAARIGFPDDPQISAVLGDYRRLASPESPAMLALPPASAALALLLQQIPGGHEPALMPPPDPAPAPAKETPDTAADPDPVVWHISEDF